MSPTTSPPLRPRAILLGLLLAGGICVLTPFNNAFRQATPLGGGHFPLAPFFIFFWLALIMAGSGRLMKRPPWLNGKELLFVWILMVLVSGIAYTGLVRTFFINLTAPFHFATPENRWADILDPLLPADWFPRSQEAVNTLYDGLPGGRRMGWLAVLRAIPWKVWLPPLLSWGTFVLLCYGVMICLVNLLSQQWLRNERMNFPLLRVPLMMEEAYSQGTLGQFLRNRFLLVGLLIPATLHLVNGLNFYYPTVPQIPTLILAGPYFPKFGFFSGFYKLKIYFYPAFIGFAFLTTRQISFSFWVFFILGGLLYGILAVMGYNIPAAALGITFGPTLTRPEEMQMVGAYFIFFLFLIWLARYHLMDVGRQTFGRAPSQASPAEWFSSRLAAWGFLLGTAAIIFWLHRLGVRWWVSGLVVGSFLMFMLVASRIITQGGLAYFTLTAAPLDGVMTLFGAGIFSAGGIFIAAVVQKALFLDLRESLMPSLVHASPDYRKNPTAPPRHNRHLHSPDARCDHLFHGHAGPVLSLWHPRARPGLGQRNHAEYLREYRNADRKPAPDEPLGPHFRAGRSRRDAAARFRLPPLLLVAAASDRLPDLLQFGHAHPVVQFFCRLALQCPVHALRRGALV